MDLKTAGQKTKDAVDAFDLGDRGILTLLLNALLEVDHITPVNYDWACHAPDSEESRVLYDKGNKYRDPDLDIRLSVGDSLSQMDHSGINVSDPLADVFGAFEMLFEWHWNHSITRYVNERYGRADAITGFMYFVESCDWEATESRTYYDPVCGLDTAIVWTLMSPDGLQFFTISEFIESYSWRGDYLFLSLDGWPGNDTFNWSFSNYTLYCNSGDGLSWWGYYGSSIDDLDSDSGVDLSKLNVYDTATWNENCKYAPFHDLLEEHYWEYEGEKYTFDPKQTFIIIDTMEFEIPIWIAYQGEVKRLNVQGETSID